jgi:flagellar motor switch protein FliN
MTEDVHFEDLDAGAGEGATGSRELERVRDVPVELAVEIGRTRMTIGEALALGPGSIVALNRLAGEPVDLLVNGTPIARGEVVVIDEEFGLRVSEVLVGGVSIATGAADAPPVSGDDDADAPDAALAA